MQSLLLLAPVLFASPAAPAAAARPAPAQASLAPEAPEGEFKERAKKAVQGGKKPEVEGLVRGDTSQAAAWIAALTESLLARDEPDDRALLEGLQGGWATAVGTDFPARVKTYLAGLDAGKAKTRVDLVKRLRDARDGLARARDVKDPLVFVQLAEELDVLSGAFESEGDKYAASEAFLLLADSCGEGVRGARAEPHQAWKALGKAIELRDSWGVHDAELERARREHKDLAARGYDKPGGGAGPAAPPVPAGPPSATAGALTVGLTFEALESPEAFARPCYQADEVYALWNPLVLGAKGTSARFERLGNEGPTLHRIGSSDLRLDLDGDGKADGPADQKIVLTGTMNPFRTTLGQGDAARPWAFFALHGQERDTFQTVQVNMQPNDTAFSVYTLSAASVVGDLAGTRIRIVDDSMDGLYGSDPLTWGYSGLSEGTYQPDLDSIVIGASKRARPWSEYQEVGGAWYRLGKSVPGGQISATPVTLQTGTLKLDFKGPVPPAWVVVRGTEDLKDCFFDLVEGGAKGVKVPAGRYTLFYGEVRKGKKLQVQKTLILPGRATPNYDVLPNGTTVVKLGAPFGFDFTLRASEETARIVGRSISIVGSATERYERPWNCVPHTEAAWRKKGAKKGSKPERMGLILDTEALYDRGEEGWHAIWFPLDHEFGVKGNEGGVEVQITAKKHDLFGKIDSEWKD